MKILRVREREKAKYGRGGRRAGGGCTVDRSAGREPFRVCEKRRGRGGGAEGGLDGRSDAEREKETKRTHAT